MLLGLTAATLTGIFRPITALASTASIQLPWPAGVTYNPGIQNGCSYDCPPGHLGADYYAIDWNLGSGSQVAAVLGGAIHFVYDSCGGNIAWIDHGGGLISYYGHLGSYAAGLGDGTNVSAGQLIAYSDNTGSCTSGAHLHFAMHSGATTWSNGYAYAPEPLAAPNGATYTGFGSCGASSYLHSNQVSCGPYTSTAASNTGGCPGKSDQQYLLLSSTTVSTYSGSPWYVQVFFYLKRYVAPDLTWCFETSVTAIYTNQTFPTPVMSFDINVRVSCNHSIVTSVWASDHSFTNTGLSVNSCWRGDTGPCNIAWGADDADGQNGSSVTDPYGHIYNYWNPYFRASYVTYGTF
jgi:hypothetical protein